METNNNNACDYSAKLVYFAKGPAWTCQKYGKHIITIHWGDTPESRKAAEETAAKLNSIPDNN